MNERVETSKNVRVKISSAPDVFFNHKNLIMFHRKSFSDRFDEIYKSNLQKYLHSGQCRDRPFKAQDELGMQSCQKSFPPNLSESDTGLLA